MTTLNQAADLRQEDSGDGPLQGDNKPSLVTEEHTLPRPPGLRFIFFGPAGLRPGWGLLLFLLIFAGLATTVNLTHRKLSHHAAKTPAQIKADAAAPQTPGSMITAEGIGFAMIAVSSWIMSRIERRPVGRYGFGGRLKLGRFFAGFLWGFLFLSVLVAVLWKAGLLVFDGRLLFGTDVLKYGAIWMIGFLLVGLLEEYMLRGYLQYTLARGIGSLCEMLLPVKKGETLGFWIAALLLSFLFGFGHGNNPGESPIGLFSAGAIGAIFCYTLWKTGSLWWALGFHASWDWAQSFVFGVADSGTMVQGHLLGSHPVGKVLLSGGATGPEGSAFILPLLLVAIGVIVWTLPRREWSIEAAGS